ncbi:MAG: chemoreceptor glutamine deamidase CheD, partial [Pseudomonadales bacterium]
PRVLPGFESIQAFWQPKWKRYCVKIKPGEFYVSGESIVITTVLGSCVSACIYDEHCGIGGMNHFMLPQSGQSSNLSRSMRYGLFAMEQLINEIMKHGGKREHMQVKITGGGNMLNSYGGVGAQNIEFIQNYIKEEQLQLSGCDLGGTSARKIAYFPDEGRMLVNKIGANESLNLVESERSFRERATSSVDDTEVELF